MPERKRGYRIDDFAVKKEAKELAPYPAWKAWRHSLYKYLRTNNFGTFNSKENPYLHEFYILNVKCRKNKVPEREIEEVIEGHQQRLKEEHPGLFENPAFVLAFGYIEKKIQKKKV